LSLPTDWQAYDVLYVTAKDANKQEIFTWSFKISLPNKIAESIVKKSGNDEVKIAMIDSLYTISVKNLQVSINKFTGLLQKVQNEKGVIPFNNGPIVQEGATNFKNFSQRIENGNVIITSTFDRKNSYNTLEWTIYPSGWVKMKVNYFPGDYFTTFFGVNFHFLKTK